MKTALIAAVIAVTYIGRREFYKDRIYGTGLEFEQGQTRRMPAEVARKFLKHADQFEVAAEAPPEPNQADKTEADKTEADKQDDDTAAILEAARLAKEVETKKLDEMQALYDQVAIMDKAALSHFAKTNYRQDINARHTLVDLRAEVTGFIDRFGVV